MHRVVLVLLLLALPARAAVDVGGGVGRTAQAVRAAVKKHRLDGDVWLGKLRGVGGGRDTLIYMARGLDAAKPIELVVFMEGIRSFGDATMDHRHAAAIARLRGNFVYVAPDAPSSSHGDALSRNEHWEAGCAARACDGGHAAPGDFLVFLDEVRSKIAQRTSAKSIDLRLSLIGFSRGGKGVLQGLVQLEAAQFVVGGARVTIGDVVFADGNYKDDALTGTWHILRSRPEAPHMTILVAAGEFSDKTEPNNRQRALAFWREVAPDAARPEAYRPVFAPRLRLIPLVQGHHAIGDAAVDYLETLPGRAPTT